MNNSFEDFLAGYFKDLKFLFKLISCCLPVILVIVIVAIVASPFLNATNINDKKLQAEFQKTLKNWDVNDPDYNMYDKTITYKKVVFDEAFDGLEILDKITIKQPFDEVLITQLAKVPGVSDGGASLHGAIDMVPLGLSNTDIMAGIDGIIVENGFDEFSGYYITIEDLNTKIHVNYCHLLFKSPKKLRSFIKKGEVLGVMGNTGISFGAHVHMQVSIRGKNGKYYWVDFLNKLSNYRIQGQYFIN